MKIEQIQYVLEIYNTGSISQAAKRLFVSQPNMSYAIKTLEQELGYNILIRTKNGVSFTERGIEFVRHGRYIIEHLEQIAGLTTGEVSRNFSLASPWYPPAEYAYYKLCLAYEEQSGIRFSIRNTNVHEAIDKVHAHSCDIGVIVSNHVAAQRFQEGLRQKNIRYVHINTLQCNVNLAQDHPLLADEKFDFEKLWDYPYVKYRDPNFQEPSNTLSFVNPGRVIEADSREVRSLIVTNSRAYSMGLPLPPKRTAELAWVSVPIPDAYLDFGYIISKNRPMPAIAKEYLELLNSEMRFLANSSEKLIKE